MNQIQNLLYDALIKTQHVESAALIKVKEAIALTSPGYHLQPQQVNGIIDAFKNPAALRREGLHFREKNYKCIRADKNSIYAKCDVISVRRKYDCRQQTLLWRYKCRYTAGHHVRGRNSYP
ncbi:profilin-4 isoform X2 [Hyla sarda]|uniref:profilin-4 isoform X2 n=1 Tax=Hyla sarda TaxID=327740 RepID=UPI0024C399C6|nr:profilin-4 isoform X2 [Hyla sarda]